MSQTQHNMYIWIALMGIFVEWSNGKCCFPNQWEGIEMVDIGTTSNGKSVNTKVKMRVSLDKTTNKIAEHLSITSSTGTKSHEFVLQDYDKGIQYTVVNGTCTKTPISMSEFPIQCIPDNATVELKSFISGGSVKIATTTYTISFPGIGEGHLTVTDRGCYPVMYELVAEVEGVSIFEAVALYGITEGIRNPSVFSVPGVCKSAMQLSVKDRRLIKKGVVGL